MKNGNSKFHNKLPIRRKLMQVITAILYNCHFTGFASGSIYQGSLKTICTPGLNCYSCPGAVCSCPLGSLQSALVSSRYKFPYYMLGLLLLMGLLFGRFICGFLCPFGLIQELLYKLPTPKLKKSKATRILSYSKYAILAFFAILIPIGLIPWIPQAPGFCKYICPAGTLEAGLPLVIKNEVLQALIGNLYTFKVVLLALILISMIFIYRSFCRFICPLGAIYSFFNKISLVQIQVDEAKCTHCDVCTRQCRMDVKCVGDHECIMCGDCIGHCHADAICYKAPQIHTKDRQSESPDQS